MIRHHTPAAYAAVFIGGAAGGILRLALDHAMSLGVWNLVLINLLGSGAMGFLTVMTHHDQWLPVRITAGTGFLGGFTTFSGLAALTWDGPVWARVLLLFATIAGAVIAAWIGDRIGEHSLRAQAKA